MLLQIEVKYHLYNYNTAISGHTRLFHNWFISFTCIQQFVTHLGKCFVPVEDWSVSCTPAQIPYRAKDGHIPSSECFKHFINSDSVALTITISHFPLSFTPVNNQVFPEIPITIFLVLDKCITLGASETSPAVYASRKFVNERVISCKVKNIVYIDKYVHTY